MADPKAADKQAQITKKLSDYKNREASLTHTEYKDYLSLLDSLNLGSEDLETSQTEAKAKFRQAVIGGLGAVVKDADLVNKLADKAVQRFIVERKTGEMSLADFLAQEGNLDAKIVKKGVEAIAPNSFLTFTNPGDYGSEISRVNKLAEQTRQNEEVKAQEQQYQQLAETQRKGSADTFQQALQAFQQPLPTFTPEFSEAALGKLQGDIARQGESALSRTESGFAERGLTGSSIEAFGKAQTEGNVADAFAQATLNFLQQSGTSAQRNREFLASQLFNQAQTMLSAGQQSQGLAANQGQFNANNLTAQNQLQTQIAQFNQQFQESQRQFNEQIGFQKEQAQSNLALLLQQMSQGGGINAGGIATGALGGAASGALVGSVVPGIGTAIGAGVGAVTGGLGSYFGQRR